MSTSSGEPRERVVSTNSGEPRERVVSTSSGEPRERVGVFPGTFNPPTVAHLAIADAAVAHAGLVRLDLVLSRAPLGKDPDGMPGIEARAGILRAMARTRPWLEVRITDERLIADIAQGYDVVVLGADKWEQVNDPAWYGGSAAARDAALARLPRALVAPRAGVHPTGAEVLEIDAAHAHVSATEARTGALHLAVPEAHEVYRNLGPA